MSFSASLPSNQSGFLKLNWQSKLYRDRKDLGWTVSKISLEQQFWVHKGCVNSVCWSSNGLCLLSGSDDRNLAISMPFNPEPKSTSVFSGHQANIFSARFLPHTGDKKVASAAGNGRVSLTDLEVADGLECVRSFASHRSAVFDLVVSQWDPGVFFSVSGDGTIRQFDVREAHCGSSLLLSNQHCSPPGFTAAALHPTSSGRRLFVASRDGAILEFDRRYLPCGTDSPLYLSRTAVSNNRISCLEFDRPGYRLLASCAGGLIYLFDLVGRRTEQCATDAGDEDGDCGYPVLGVFRGHRNSRSCIQQATFWGSAHILSGSDCGHLLAWRIADCKLVAARPADQCLVNRVAANPELLCLATSGTERDVKLWSPMQHSESADLLEKSDAAYAEELARRNQQVLACSETVVRAAVAIPYYAAMPAGPILDAGLLPT